MYSVIVKLISYGIGVTIVTYTKHVLSSFILRAWGSTFGLFGGRVTISTYTVHNYIYILHYSITYSELNFKKEIEKLEYSERNLHSTGEMINGNSIHAIYTMHIALGIGRFPAI